MAVWVLFLFSFFLSLKDVRKIDLWNWLLEHRLCLAFISAIPASGPFLRATVFNCPTGLLNWRCQSALADKCSHRKCPQGGSTYSRSTGCTCTQSLRESRLPGLWIRVECAWANTQELESPYFFPLKLHPSPSDSCLPWAPLPAEVPRTLHSQEGQGTPALETSILGDFTLYPESGHHSWGSLGSLAPARETRQYRLKRSLSAGHPARLCGPHPQPWDWVYSGSREGIASHRGQGHKPTVYFFPFILSHASAMLKSSQFAVLCLSSVSNWDWSAYTACVSDARETS